MFDNINNQPASGQNNQSGFNNPPDTGAGSAPGTRPGVITDMYADIDRPEKPDAFKPKQTFNQANPGYDNIPPEMLDSSGGAKQKIFTLLIVIIGMVILGAGGYYGFKFYKNNFAPRNITTTPENAVDNTVSNIPETKTEDNNSQASTEPAVIASSTPTNDLGSTTENPQPTAEQASTTSETVATTTETAPAANLDTDQDGLTDIEEAALGTSPTNVDSDSDGLSDREEVKVYKTNPLNPDTDGDGFTDGDEVKKGYNPNGSGKLYDINNQQPIK